MTYSEKLKDPRWQKKRLEVLNEAQFTCQTCGAKDKELHVHHLCYAKEPWNVDNDCLIVLCHECHENLPKMLAPALKDMMIALGPQGLAEFRFGATQIDFGKMNTSQWLREVADLISCTNAWRRGYEVAQGKL